MAQSGDLLLKIMNISKENKKRNSNGKIFIGIGIGPHPISNFRILEAAKNAPDKDGIRILLVGKRESLVELKEKLGDITSNSNNIFLYPSNEPERFLIYNCIGLPYTDSAEYTIDDIKSLNPHMDGQDLADLIKKDKRLKLNSIIRGTLGSSGFLKILRNLKNETVHSEILSEKLKSFDFSKTYRLALLETYDGFQFFYAPVGIDEINEKGAKMECLEHVIRFYNSIGVKPKIALLSGGRKGDVGREGYIDRNIRETEEITETFSRQHPDIDIIHEYILIEKAIADRSNVIIAPEGISGNLIYRTLVHLGGGKAYGAVYLNYYNDLNMIIIDTSRAAERSEYEGAIKLAAYL